MKFIIFLIILITLPMYSQNSWVETYKTTGNPVKIEVLDSNNIFIVSSGGWPTYLYRSTDKGINWKKIYEGKKIQVESALDMSVIDKDNIYLSFSRGHMLRSNNGGMSFDWVSIDTALGRVTDITMYNKDIGAVNGGRYITKKAWKTYDKLDLNPYYNTCSLFINDSILYSIVYDGWSNSSFYFFLLKLNINTQIYELHYIDHIYEGLSDLSIVKGGVILTCGKSNNIEGGSGHDAIYKSTDSGKNWRRVLDLYSEAYKFPNYLPAFGLQQIAFKDSLTGIAVGQFGKILYTYDGGESWIYESNIHESIDGTATMCVRYTGSVPIIATYSGRLFRMTKDNLAPDPNDKYTISGRVWLGDKGQSGVSVFLNDYRVTMTDSLGYYRFKQLKQGLYSIQAKNKYIDNPQYTYFYRPFEYSPTLYTINLTSDTIGFDFNATDLRTYHTISGYVVDKDGQGLADIDVRFAHSVITADGLGLADTITKTDATGKFEFDNIESYKTWDITAYDEKIKFSPLKHTVRLYTNDTTDLKFVGSPVTSVDDNVITNSIIISPNPASDYIELSLDRCTPPTRWSPSDKIQVFNMLGVEVKDLTPALSKNGEGVRIDVSDLPAGVYFVRIGGMVEKFVKM